MRFKRVPFSVLYTVFEQRIDCIGCMQCIYCTVLYFTVLYTYVCTVQHSMYTTILILHAVRTVHYGALWNYWMMHPTVSCRIVSRYCMCTVLHCAALC